MIAHEWVFLKSIELLMVCFIHSTKEELCTLFNIKLFRANASILSVSK